MKRPRKLFQITDKDEFKHVWPRYQEHHNESWYFNFIDFNTNTHMVTRVGYRLGVKEIETMTLLVVDKEINEYFNRSKIEGFPEEDIYGDTRMKYECLEPMILPASYEFITLCGLL